MEEKEAAAAAGESLKLQIKFGGETIPLSFSPDFTVADLKSTLQSTTNVLPRGQKLIHKGKVLEDSKTLRSSGITNGSKIMLMASQGLHQGDGPKLKNSHVVSNYGRVGWDVDRKPDKPAIQVSIDKSRFGRWKLTGVVALSQCHLEAIPDEVWDCGSAARVLELSNNHISSLPTKIISLGSLQKLILTANEISDNSICWEELHSLKSLAVFSLSHNQLTTLPASLGALSSLRQLHIANNQLAALPDEIGLLVNLEILSAKNNRLRAIPSCIGNCQSLAEVDLSSNLLSELPGAFGNLLNLKALHLRNNGIKSLPSTLFKNCTKLATLDLHGTQITMDMLRESEGWEEFDERRRLKLQKQLDFRAGGSAQFDEGADKS